MWVVLLLLYGRLPGVTCPCLIVSACRSWTSMTRRGCEVSQHEVCEAESLQGRRDAFDIYWPLSSYQRHYRSQKSQKHGRTGLFPDPWERVSSVFDFPFNNNTISLK